MAHHQHFSVLISDVLPCEDIFYGKYLKTFFQRSVFCVRIPEMLAFFEDEAREHIVDDDYNHGD